MKNDISRFCSDWISLFPQLQRYKRGRKLLTRFNTIVYGIELRKIDIDVYRPEFICLNLLSSFNEFSLNREFTTASIPQGDIEHRHHTEYFQILAQVIKKKTPLLETPKHQISDIINLYRTHIEFDISRGVSPMGKMTSLIQQAKYHNLPEIEKIELQRQKVYFDSLPIEYKNNKGTIIHNELSQSVINLSKNMEINLKKSGWDDLT